MFSPKCANKRHRENESPLWQLKNKKFKSHVIKGMKEAGILDRSSSLCVQCYGEFENTVETKVEEPQDDKDSRKSAQEINELVRALTKKISECQKEVLGKLDMQCIEDLSEVIGSKFIHNEIYIIHFFFLISWLS